MPKRVTDRSAPASTLRSIHTAFSSTSILRLRRSAAGSSFAASAIGNTSRAIQTTASCVGEQEQLPAHHRIFDLAKLVDLVEQAPPQGCQGFEDAGNAVSVQLFT
ncbi:MAG: hypothetical protein ACLP4W_03235 [Mycobacterium sp.]|uniref:hypothetical protein n=1 Tax=Mycobacterium sp. TaxID=1785 RepID=UPI003F98CADB